MMPAEQYSYLSSRLVREVAQLGGSIAGLGAGDGGTALDERNSILRIKLQTHEERKAGKTMSTVTQSLAAVKLTERINRIEPSATMAVVAEADKLRQQGIDVVDFGAGEPHFSTPQHIKDAAIAAIQNNFTKYTAVGGTAELRDAIVHRHARGFRFRLPPRRSDRLDRRKACVVQCHSGAGGSWR